MVANSVGPKNIKSNTSPYVVVGLGNPGTKYDRTRHNVGFAVVDVLSQLIDELAGREVPTRARVISADVVKGSTVSNQLSNKGDYAFRKYRIGSHQVFLFKPLTYMNRSGEPLSEFLRFQKVPLDNLVVIHDEIDLPLGSVRIKQGGGEGGHNGLRSISQMCGGKQYIRVRVGVGKPDPVERAFQGSDGVARWVLSTFSVDEQDTLVESIATAVSAVFDVIQAGTSHAQNRHNC
jgi:PTH1 family peptidyl-tRNA hydrolase